MMMLEMLFSNIAEITVSTSVIIILLFMLSKLIHKTFAAKWCYWVWLLLSIRLLIPFHLTLQNTPIVIVPQKVVEQTGKAAVYSSASAAMQGTVPAVQNTPIDWMQVAALLWLTGAALFMIYQLVNYLLFRKSAMRWSKEITDEKILMQFKMLCSEMYLTDSIKIMCSKKVSSPMMFGFFEPVLLLPTQDYSELELSAILKHELVHFKRHDCWYKLLLLLANSVHWFNPLVYFMVWAANRDMEFSCDDEVVCSGDMNFRKCYSQTILTAIKQEQLRHTALSTYFKENKKSLKTRFANICDMTKKRKGVFSLCVIAVLCVICGTFVACTNTAKQVNEPTAARLLSYKTAYVGDNSKVVGLIDTLSVPNGVKRDIVSLKTDAKPYAVTVQYQVQNIKEVMTDGAVTDSAFYKNAMIMFSLIDNVDAINIDLVHNGATYRFPFTRQTANQYLNADVRKFSSSEKDFQVFLTKLKSFVRPGEASNAKSSDK